MTSLPSPMHQASLIGQNIIVTTGCSSSHLPLAGPSSTLSLCVTRAPFPSRTLTHTSHAHSLPWSHMHFSGRVLTMRFPHACPHFLSLQPHTAVRVHGHEPQLRSVAIFSLVCAKKPGENKSFRLFPHCLRWFMKVPLTRFDSLSCSGTGRREHQRDYRSPC